VATKQDLGLDYAFFNNNFNGSIDYFRQRRTGIYMARNYLPGIVALESVPSANVGEVTASGFDGNFAYKQKVGKVNLTIRGNITYSKNKII
jgi:hypothetical protein